MSGINNSNNNNNNNNNNETQDVDLLTPSTMASYEQYPNDHSAVAFIRTNKYLKKKEQKLAATAPTNVKYIISHIYVFHAFIYLFIFFILILVRKHTYKNSVPTKRSAFCTFMSISKHVQVKHTKTNIKHNR